MEARHPEFVVTVANHCQGEEEDRLKEGMKQKPVIPNMVALEAKLAGFTGTDHYYRTNGSLVYTDGIKAMADLVGAYRLIDLIGVWQGKRKSSGTAEQIGKVHFQVWRVESKDGAAVVTMREDTTGPVLARQVISATAFPPGVFECWLIDGVLLLKGEY